MPDKNERTFMISSKEDALKLAKLIVAERDGDTTYKPAIYPVEDKKEAVKEIVQDKTGEDMLYRDRRDELNIKKVN